MTDEELQQLLKEADWMPERLNGIVVGMHHGDIDEAIKTLRAVVKARKGFHDAR